MMKNSYPGESEKNYMLSFQTVSNKSDCPWAKTLAVIYLDPAPGPVAPSIAVLNIQIIQKSLLFQITVCRIHHRYLNRILLTIVWKKNTFKYIQILLSLFFSVFSTCVFYLCFLLVVCFCYFCIIALLFVYLLWLDLVVT